MSFSDFRTQYTDDKVRQMVEPHVVAHRTESHVVAGRTLRYDAFDISSYRVVITQSEDQSISFGTCNCEGFMYRTKCKHIHYALNKIGEVTTTPPNNTKQ